MDPLFQPVLHGPHPPISATGEDGTVYLRHAVSGRYLVATPEEWVRQNLLIHLLAIGYPAGLIATEREMRLGRMRRRFDVLVYDRNSVPFLVAECKAPEVSLGLNAQAQAAEYNSKLGAHYVLLTNGRSYQLYAYQGAGYEPRELLPEYPSV